jgi:hypothetical protein
VTLSGLRRLALLYPVLYAAIHEQTKPTALETGKSLDGAVQRKMSQVIDLREDSGWD